jgi:hypothetical protein
MSEANRTAVRAVKETSFRVPPNNPAYQELRFNSESLTYAPTTEVSNEIDPTRQVKDLILTGFEASGDIATEYSLENLDMFMEGGFCNPWLRTPEVYNGPGWEYGTSATRITAVSSTALTIAGSSVLAGSATNATGASFVAGQLLRLSGFVSNNGLFPITAGAATSVTASGLTAEASPPASARAKVVGFQGAAADLVASTSGGSALTSTALNFTTLGLIVGQWVKISSEGGAYSFANAAANGYCRVSAIAANRLSFDITVGGWAADTGSGKTIRVYYGDTIRNGTTAVSYRIEKNYVLDAGVRYAYFRGMEVGTMAFSGDTRAVLTATLTFTGSDSTTFSATRDTGASTIPSSTGTVLDSSNSIPMLLEAGLTLASPNFVSSFAFSLENSLRAQNAVGSPGAVGIGLGRSSFTGNLNTYFGDETLLNKLLTSTASSVTFQFRDTGTFKSEIWDAPRIKYSSGAPEVTGVDTDIFANLAFQGLRDVLNNRDYTVMVSRFDYVV